MTHEMEGEQTVLNFGLNPIDMYRYDSANSALPAEDMIVTVHPKGALKRINETGPAEYEEFPLATPERIVLSSPNMERSFPAVKFSLKKDGRREHTILLVWIEERREWVAITYAEWQEDALRSGEKYSGPFALDAYCKTKLAEAYGREADTLNRELIRMSPEELQR